MTRRSRLRLRHLFFSVAFIALYLAAFSRGVWAQASTPKLTVEQVFGKDGLADSNPIGAKWSPDGKEVSYLRRSGAAGKDAIEVWSLNILTGKRRCLIDADSSRRAGLFEENLPLETQAERYQWSPDGKSILFQKETALIWFDIQKRQGRKLVDSKATVVSPRISPDGCWVGFAMGYNLWAVGVSSGSARPLTTDGSEEIRKGQVDWLYAEEFKLPAAFWWSPDSKSIAYLEFDERKVGTYTLQDPVSATGETKKQRYPEAGGENPRVRVLTVAFNGLRSRVMDTGQNEDIYLPRVEWLPNGKQIAIQRLNRAQTELDLLLADAGSGVTRTILNEKDPYWINVGSELRFLSDGKRFIWSSERTGYRHLYLYDLSGKLLTQLTRGEWEVTQLCGINEAANSVYFSAKQKSPIERHLYSVRLDGSELKQVTHGRGTHDVLMPPTSVPLFMERYSRASLPPVEQIRRLDDSLVTTVNKASENMNLDAALAPAEFLQVKSSEGIWFNAMMIKPRGFDSSRKYPVIIHAFEGPGTQVAFDGWAGAASWWQQILADSGYVVFALDPRGSSGRGHLFEEPIHRLLGGLEVADEYDGVRYLESLAYVDPTRIGIWGWGYGGYLSLRCSFWSSKAFRVGFAGAPIADWREYDSVFSERYMGKPEQNNNGYNTSAVLDQKLRRFHAALLLAHGTADEKSHFENSLSILNKLIDSGYYAELAIFPRRDFDFTDPAARQILFQRVTRFFEDNL